MTLDNSENPEIWIVMKGNVNQDHYHVNAEVDGAFRTRNEALQYLYENYLDDPFYYGDWIESMNCDCWRNEVYWFSLTSQQLLSL